MPIPTTDKTKGKRQIMRQVEPAILELCFTKNTGSEFTKISEDGRIWRILFSVPTFAPLYRIYPSINREGEKPILGPNTDPFQAPNTPNGIRYNFRFHLSPDTYDRCADNLIRWMQQVALPWFHSSPEASWTNPNAPS
jgi:hypothetical protein